MTCSWTLITNALLVDGAGNPPVPNMSVLLRDDRIYSVEQSIDRSAVPRDDKLTEIDANGLTIMPGLIDSHCHMTYGESRSEEEIDLYTSPELRTLKAAWNAQKVLRAGVTGISQPGGSYYIGVGLREAIREGYVVGPRMTAAGRYITTSNGLTDFYPDSVGVPQGSIGLLANTIDEMKSELRHQVKNGVDLIKLADSPMGQFQSFTDDEMKELADLAHQLKVTMTIHARGSAEVDAAVRAGIDWIMHGNIMTDDTIGRLSESGITLVPTLLLLANPVDFADYVGVPKGMRNAYARMLEETADSLHRAKAAGVKFGLGTDSGFALTAYGEWHARELELLMRYAGLSSLEAIQAGTQNGALMLGLEGEIGVVAPGYIADLILVRGDPVKDIRVLQNKKNIRTVIQGGKVIEFDETSLARRWPHERGQTMSYGDLLFDDVLGDGPQEAPSPDEPDKVLDDAEVAADLTRDLTRSEIKGRRDTN
ncbi:amidohydrolase family protein [Mycobacterium sp. CBMA293]|uniref:metal-dependent hydrolase family protein n=1 Tax=unclassified Mycolicibacterium TaxID=2636767 RepID=UPI0012DCB3D3|nr:MULTISPECIES: amidohydrolase family protein [unclassified Mycolicibacterium]MUL49405.1 amidohydrolase family protein [Mycolicibacterium sp. CBMA 360]MUL62581.1 amidohydrolase family protein [Mycolicibacterium sp. CBMA 335]MUL69033.1 amidohydrolase family protein [Mycolicibacterium sp. CBMA 311]MUL96972.1 amidohydrolase family protein [Mycolicibacterium sp. CBMA 230]MUM03990.1 amidohydrolase [Mycolicibacterium sp. CBMA 213]